jgi:predicted nucleotidyltransferase
MSLAANDGARLDAALGAALGGDPRVAAVLLFGSRATGRARPDSDIDLAVLLAAPPGDPSEIRRELLERLVGAVATERVDLVLLDEASAALAFQVLKYGRRVLVADPVRLHRFTVRTYREHGDFAWAEQVFRAATRARALRGGRHD